MGAGWTVLVAAMLFIGSTDTARAPETRVYRHTDHGALQAHVFDPAPHARTDAAILLFHGGGYFTGSPAATFDTARAFADAGFTSVAVEYRLSNDRITPLEALADACAALDWVRSDPRFAGLDRSKVILYGVSAGAHLAVNSITHGCRPDRPPPAALLLFSPGLDVLGHAPRFAAQLRGRADPRAHAPLETMAAALPPIAIVHGAADAIDPIETSQRLCRLQRQFGGVCRLDAVPGRGHLLSRSLDRQVPGPGFVPDREAARRADAFFIRFLREQVLAPQ